MISAELYYSCYIFFVAFCCLLKYFSLRNSNNNIVYKSTNVDFILSLLIVLIISLFLGYRPIDAVFVDTIRYVLNYNNVQSGHFFANIEENEYIWDKLMFLCNSFGFTSHDWLFVIALLYFLLPLLAFRKLVKNYTLLALLFFLSAFSTYNYAVNGLKNGLACSVVIYAVALIKDVGIMNNWKTWILCFIALGIHKSTILPILCILILQYYKNIKLLYFFWGFSIVLSLLFGQTFANYLVSLGIDNRLDSYLTADVDSDKFSKIGFRWDFLLYSSMPILLGAYYFFIKKVYNVRYIYLMGIYLISNSFWIIIIRSSFSNRFAYLSWFLYPIMLVYPLVTFNTDNNRLISNILLLHFGFTLFMYLL